MCCISVQVWYKDEKSGNSLVTRTSLNDANLIERPACLKLTVARKDAESHFPKCVHSGKDESPRWSVATVASHATSIRVRGTQPEDQDAFREADL